MKGKHFGKCALCGKECDLTFEHIPPRAAFNSTPARPVSGDELIGADDRMPWDLDGLRYLNQQQGMGRYSLCSECNNNTGSWYGDAYNEFAHIVHYVLLQHNDDRAEGVGIKQVYVLKLIKQVLSMFCSINNFDDTRIDTLRKFVLNRNDIGIDKTKYKLCMYFTRSNLIKFAPLSVVIKMAETGVDYMAVSEITAYPLGFLLYFNPTDTWEYEGLDITHFANYPYDKAVDLEIPFCIKEVNDIFPAFFRSKVEIQKCVEDSKKWVEEHGN